MLRWRRGKQGRDIFNKKKGGWSIISKAETGDRTVRRKGIGVGDAVGVRTLRRSTQPSHECSTAGRTCNHEGGVDRNRGSVSKQGRVVLT